MTAYSTLIETMCLSYAIFELFSPLGKPANQAIYFTLRNFFLFIYFTMSKAISISTGPIITIFSPNGTYLRELSRSGPVFSCASRMLQSATQVVRMPCRVSNPVFTETEKPGNPEFFQNRKTGFGCL